MHNKTNVIKINIHQKKPWPSTAYLIFASLSPISLILYFSRYFNLVLFFIILLFYLIFTIYYIKFFYNYAASALIESVFSLGQVIFLILTYILSINAFIPSTSQKNTLLLLFLLLPGIVLIFNIVLYGFNFKRDLKIHHDLILKKKVINFNNNIFDHDKEREITEIEDSLHSKDLQKMRWLLRTNALTNFIFIIAFFKYFHFEAAYVHVFLLIIFFVLIYFTTTFLKCFFMMLVSYKVVKNIERSYFRYQHI